MQPSSEKSKDVLTGEQEVSAEETSSQSESGNNTQENPEPKKTRINGGKKSADEFKNAQVVHHCHKHLKSGDTCPACKEGKIYKFRPAEFVRIIGLAPLQAQVNVQQTLRCNMCLEVFKAELPESLLNDGDPSRRYANSARSMIALLKYGAGTPFYRQHTLQQILGIPVDPVTLWNQCEALANEVNPIFESLKKIAAEKGVLFYGDDTWARIINQPTHIIKPNRKTGKDTVRSGVHTSGVTVQLEGSFGHHVVLYKTGINHVGEFLDELLKFRTSTAPFIAMSDGLSSNKITVTSNYVETFCNAHARRQLVELRNTFPEEVETILNFYATIYRHDAQTKENCLTPTQRMEFHRLKSLPVVTQLFEYIENLISGKKCEPNSALGKAIFYMLERKAGLTAFCHVENVPIDNNLQERKLKIAVLHRKNSLFFKHPIGAKVADILMSIIATAASFKINAFDYLNFLQLHKTEVRKTPEQFMPWNYQTKIPQT